MKIIIINKVLNLSISNTADHMANDKDFTNYGEIYII